MQMMLLRRVTASSCQRVTCMPSSLTASIVPVCAVLRERASASSSKWSDGDVGYSWKQRSLDDQRGVAMDFMGNVAKRTPIHDGVRMKAKQSERALLKETTTAEAESPDSPAFVAMSGVDSHSDAYRTADDDMFGDDFFDDLLGGGGGGGDEDAELEGEACGDVIAALRNMPKSDLALLSSELYGDASEASEATRQKILRNWFALRARGSQHMNFASSNMNVEHRNQWSPWYLAHELRRKK